MGRWHQLWRTKIEAKGAVVSITATEHEGRQHTVILQREELDVLLSQGQTPVTTVARDGDLLVAWMREAADELENAHAVLDRANVSRRIPNSDAECTLAARIAMLVTDRDDLQQEVYDQGERS